MSTIITRTENIIGEDIPVVTNKRVVQSYGKVITKREHTPLVHKVHGHEKDTPGIRLRKARLEKNLFLRELAELTGLTPENIRNIEKDVYECKSGLKVTTAKKLAKALDKPIWYIGFYDKLTEKTLGQKLKKARLYHGHTLEETAKYLGVDEKTIRNWEKDKKSPRTDMLKRLKKYLEILITGL